MRVVVHNYSSPSCFYNLSCKNAKSSLRLFFGVPACKVFGTEVQATLHSDCRFVRRQRALHFLGEVAVISSVARYALQRPELEGVGLCTRINAGADREDGDGKQGGVATTGRSRKIPRRQ